MYNKEGRLLEWVFVSYCFRQNIDIMHHLLISIYDNELMGIYMRNRHVRVSKEKVCMLNKERSVAKVLI